MVPDINSFSWYGPSHWVVLVGTAGLAVAAVLAGRRERGRPDARVTLWVLRVLVVGSVVPHHVYKFLVQERVPLEMCDWTGLVAIVALFTGHALPAALLFYWGLTLTPNALLTPDLAADFPSLGFLMFFVSHSATVVAAAYVTWGRGARIDWRLYAKTIAVSLVLLAGILTWNAVFNENYMYLRAKPAAGSLLDFLGPWPVYVAVEVALAFGLWALITWPFTRR